VDTFTSDTAFWDILKHFEQKCGHNLTARSGSPPKEGLFKNLLMKKAVYMMPVCIFMNKEYASIGELMSTSLEMAGLSSGTGVIRLLFKYIDSTLEEVLSIVKDTPRVVKPTVLPVAPTVIAPVVKELPKKPDAPLVQAPIEQDGTKESESETVPFDRDIRVYRPPPADYTMTRCVSCSVFL
jgi:hypothetical protein